DSKTAAQGSHHGPEIPTTLDRQLVRHDSYARHHLVQLQALRSDNRNPGCNSLMDADGEIYNLQNLGSSNAAKECVQYWLASFATNERDSRKIIFSSQCYFRKARLQTPHLNSLLTSSSRGEHAHEVRLCLWQRERIKVRV